VVRPRRRKEKSNSCSTSTLSNFKEKDETKSKSHEQSERNDQSKERKRRDRPFELGKMPWRRNKTIRKIISEAERLGRGGKRGRPSRELDSLFCRKKEILETLK